MSRVFHNVTDLEVRVLGADISKIINKACEQNISVKAIRPISELESMLRISQGQYENFCVIARQFGGEVRPQRKAFISRLRDFSYKHKLLLFSSLVFILLFSMLPTRILFLTVSGNDTIPESEILKVCAEQGLHTWTNRKSVRSEQLKNSLIKEFPSVKWVGVNTSGACATIYIEENAVQEAADAWIPGDVVAAMDGTVKSIEVKEGQTLCNVGQQVKAGDVLISGQMDVGLCTLSKKASGEVYADVLHKICSVLPRETEFALRRKGVRRFYRLQYQNLSIKCWISSGISDAFCDRICRQYLLTLPGGFVLPLSLQVDTYVPYEHKAEAVEAADAFQDLASFAEESITNSMVAGVIDSSNLQFTEDEALYRLDGLYHCCEMIGRTKAYEVGDVYGKNN